MKYKKIPYNNIEIVKIFLKKFRQGKHEQCWNWESTCFASGYGVISYGGKKNRLQFLAHRFSYSYFNQKQIGDLVIDHLCENRKCVNPNHLEPTTITENILRTFIRNPGKKNITILPKSLVNGKCSRGHIVENMDDLVNYKSSGNNNYKCKQCIKYRKFTFKTLSLSKKLIKGKCIHNHVIKNINDITKQGKCKQCVINYNNKWKSNKGKGYHQHYYETVTKTKHKNAIMDLDT